MENGEILDSSTLLQIATEETSRQTNLNFDTESGLYFDTEKDLYYDPDSQIYYDYKDATYYRNGFAYANYCTTPTPI